MKIKTRLAFRFALIASSILLLFAVGIYYFSSSYISKRFQNHLKNKAITTSKLLENVAGIDSSMLARIDNNTINQLYDETHEIYDFKNKLLYYFNEGKTKFSSSIDVLNSIKKNGQIKYSEGTRDVVGILYPEKEPEYVIICSAINYTGMEELNNLKIVLIISLIVGIVLIIISALFYSREALKPISNIVDQVSNISATRLNSRVKVEERKDEISMLAITFNQMLDRLEKSFESQRSFVSNVSHELRTPLTSIKGQIDVALMKTRNVEEYISILNSLMADTENMTTLVNGFLEMAETSTEDKLLKIEPIRIDELMFSIKNEITNRKNNYVIQISFDDSINDESNLTLNANPPLLKILLNNLIDNACKFSDNNTANIIIKYEKKWLNISISDQGIGIPKDEINNITEPFYRASNASIKSGHGIGLSIANRIVSLHKGEMKISSEINKGTIINILLPLEQNG